MIGAGPTTSMLHECWKVGVLFLFCFGGELQARIPSSSDFDQGQVSYAPQPMTVASSVNKGCGEGDSQCQSLAPYILDSCAQTLFWIM